MLVAIYKRLPKNIADNLLQWWRRQALEPDFELLIRMSGVPALVVDVGANRGHSAIAVLRKTRYMKVLSLEPNPALRWALLLIKVFHPVRFSFKLVGAGNDYTKRILNIPLSPEVDLSTQASLSLAEFDKWWVRERLEKNGHDRNSLHPFRKRAIQLVTLDSLNLHPDLIKIDIEGWERQALEGALQTVRTHLPAMLVEVNDAEEWMPMLSKLGYRFYRYDAEAGLLFQCNSPASTLNLWCLHQQQQGRFAQGLRDLVDEAQAAGD